MIADLAIPSVRRDVTGDSPLEDFTAAGAREILVRESDLEAAKKLLASSTG